MLHASPTRSRTSSSWGSAAARRGDRHVVGAVAEREVEAGGRRAQRTSAAERCDQADAPCASAPAAVAADRACARSRSARTARASARSRARSPRPRGRRARSTSITGPHDEHVRAVGEVDPDAHRGHRRDDLGRPARRPQRRGLIGSARWVRASSSVTGSSSAGAHGAIAGWRWSGTGSSGARRSRRRSAPPRARRRRAWRTTYRCHAGSAPATGAGSADELAESGLRVVRAPPRGAPPPSRRARAAARAGSPPAARRGASCSRRARSVCLSREPWKRSMRAPLGDRVVVGGDRAAVAEAAEVLRREEGERRRRAERARGAAAAAARRPPAPRPRAPARRAPRSPRSGAALPNRSTATTAFVSAASARRAPSRRVTHERVGVDVAEDRPRAGRRDRLGLA